MPVIDLAHSFHLSRHTKHEDSQGAANSKLLLNSAWAHRVSCVTLTHSILGFPCVLTVDQARDFLLGRVSI